MEKAFAPLIGIRIRKAEVIHDYLQLSFEDGAVLNVFNAYTVVGASPDNLSIILESKISGVFVENESIDMEFSNGVVIRISMKESDYRGPEAIEYVGVDGVRTIW